jgi:hypothetical protein
MQLNRSLFLRHQPVHRHTDHDDTGGSETTQPRRLRPPALKSRCAHFIARLWLASGRVASGCLARFTRNLVIRFVSSSHTPPRLNPLELFNGRTRRAHLRLRIRSRRHRMPQLIFE